MFDDYKKWDIFCGTLKAGLNPFSHMQTTAISEEIERDEC